MQTVSPAGRALDPRGSPVLALDAARPSSICERVPPLPFPRRTRGLLSLPLTGRGSGDCPAGPRQKLELRAQNPFLQSHMARDQTPAPRPETPVYQGRATLATHLEKE